MKNLGICSLLLLLTFAACKKEDDPAVPHDGPVYPIVVKLLDQTLPSAEVSIYTCSSKSDCSLSIAAKRSELTISDSLLIVKGHTFNMNRFGSSLGNEDAQTKKFSSLELRFLRQ